MRGKRIRREKVKKGRVAVTILAVLCLGVVAFGAARQGILMEEYAAGSASYQALSRKVLPAPTATPEPVADTQASTTQAPIETPPPGPQVDFEALRAINPDAVAWLAIDGTDVSYPIVQGEDNKEYLKKLFTGEKNRAGCVFLDCGNSPDFSDPNSVVYGHSLNDGSMFTKLLKYKRQEFYDAHPTGWLVTPEKRYEIRFFSGFVSNVWGDAWNLSPDDSWPRRMAAQSLFTGGLTPRPGDRILTLSTCSYEFSNARFLLMGILSELE